jgi:hypothetical protein
MDFSLPADIDRLRLRAREFVAKALIPLEADKANYDEHENIRLDLLEELRARVAEKRLAALEEEIVQEKAVGLARSAERLHRALEALRAADAASPPPVPAAREPLLSTAAEALWYYVVQREACNLRDTDAVLRELRVPPEVELRMGVRTR